MERLVEVFGTTETGIPCRAAHVPAQVLWDGPPFVFGVPQRIRPIRNLPPNSRVRLRLRNGAEAFAFVKTADGVRKWNLDDNGDTWALAYCVGANVPGI